MMVLTSSSPAIRALTLAAVAFSAALTVSACGDNSAGTCGNGLVESAEPCDDGNTLDTDACSNACTVAVCGDGIVQFVNGEQCDDGNLVDGDGCSATCTLPHCGNGTLDPGEACDDGNADDTDGCRNTCAFAACGDGVVEAGVEACDDGNAVDGDACTSACAAPSCGDGVVQLGNGEQCDDGNADDADACRNNCLAARCGDTVVQLGSGEQCDDGNLVDTDACRNTCAVATCGDGVVEAGVEECDDANTLDVDSCSNACTQARCGDGITQPLLGETCDDANDVDTDACRNSCVTATCGDGIVERGVEECDDANTSNADACHTDCTADCFPDADARYIDGATGNCYGMYSSWSVDWNVAEGACQSQGGHLVSVDSTEEDALVSSLTPGQPVWIGFNDQASEGTFVWSDGTATAYTHWFAGEPNDSFGEDCAEYYGDGWNDLNCVDNTHPFVCEKPTLTWRSGVQQDVDPATLHGWSQCYSDTYNNGGTPVAGVLAACSGARLMTACRPVGATNLTLAAMGDRADVLFDCGSDVSCVHQANGVGWYFSASYSWGFAPGGEPVFRDSCDFDVGGQTAVDQRMCWHTNGGAMNAGYRCGNNELFGGDWERIIFQAN